MAAPDHHTPSAFSYGHSDKGRDLVFVWLVVMALAGALLYGALYTRVFPDASLELPLDKTEIMRRARLVAEHAGYDQKHEAVEGSVKESVKGSVEESVALPVDNGGGKPRAIQTLTFTTFDEAKTFLEYELGLKSALSLMRDKVPVWSWSVRFCREFTIEQFNVWLSPAGKLIAFDFSLEEEKALPSLSHVEALHRALAFMSGEAGVEVDGLKIVRDETNARVHRVDHTFVLENQKENYKGATIRYYVEVSGNRVSAFNHYLFVPDYWTRKYNHMRTFNDLLQNIASIFYSTLQLVSVLVVPWALSRKEMRWRFAIFGGMVMAGTSILDSLNDYASLVAEYDTTSSFRDYLWQYYGAQGASAVGQFCFGTLLFGGADVIYRRFYPGRVALESFLRPAGFATLEGLKAIPVGYCVCLIHLGWIILYYLLGEKLNFWCPLGIDNADILSSALPFYSAISLGVHASAQEETIARVVGLALGWRITKNFWLANFLQAAIWGFMHSTYAQQPAYARGVELTIIGLFYGYIMRRYGLLPCFIGHYLLDAFLEVKPLLSVTDDIWLWLSAFIPLLPFAVVGLIALFLRRLKESRPGGEEALATFDAALNNDAMVHAPQAVPPKDRPGTAFIYEPLSKKFRYTVGIFAVVSLCITFFIHLQSIGDNARCRINRYTAIARAQKILEQAGVNPAGYIAVPTLSSDVSTEELQYVYEKLKRKRTLELGYATQPGYIWQVRFFKYGKPTEYRIRLRGDGSEYSFDLSVDDDDPGATVDDARARALALDYIRRTHPEYRDFRISRLAREDRSARRDYTIDFVVPSLAVEESQYKFFLQIVGDRPCNFSQAWQLPSSWQFERQKQHQYSAILDNLRRYTYAAAICFLIYWVFGLLRAGVMQWRIPLAISAVMAALCIGEQLNHLPSIMYNYQTDMDRDTYLVNCGLDYIRSAADVFWRLFLASSLALAAFRVLVPGLPFTAILSAAFRPGAVERRYQQKQMWKDGIILALFCHALMQLKETAVYFLTYYFSPEIRGAQIDILHSLNDYFSAVLSCLLDLPQSFILSISSFLVAAALYRKYCRSFIGYMCLVLIYVLIMQSDARHPVDYFIAVFSAVANSALIWLFVARLAKFNPVFYLVKIVIEDCLPFIYAIYAYGLPGMAPDIVSFILYLLSPLGMLVYFSLRGQKPLVVDEHGDLKQ